jgi:NADH dehydrogenase [ubiquinone] 1 alpha subcomplex assembly factor 1
MLRSGVTASAARFIAALCLGIGLALPMAVGAAETSERVSKPSNEVLVFDWTRSQTAGAWSAVDDRVMGGVSRSRMRWDPLGFGSFEGRVSLENNGGFASVRALVPIPLPSQAEVLVLRVRGDGKRYALTLRTDRTFDGVAYHAGFVAPTTASPDKWEAVTLMRAAFVPRFRGRLVNAPVLQFEHARQIGLMVSDGQAGEFRLDVRSLAVRLDAATADDANR